MFMLALSETVEGRSQVFCQGTDQLMAPVFIGLIRVYLIIQEPTRGFW